MSDKIYCGNAKPFGKFNTLKLSICLDDIPEEHVKLSPKNGKRYVSVNMNENREIGKFGDTHNLTVDTWRPDNKPAFTGDRDVKLASDFTAPPAPEDHDSLPW